MPVFVAVATTAEEAEGERVVEITGILPSPGGSGRGNRNRSS
jgi:hypothetical protein